MGLMMFGRQNYKWHSHECLSQVPLEFEMATEKPKRHKSPGNDQIPAEFITSGNRTIHSEIHKLINSIWNKEELPVDWKESIAVPTY
jgi:hypothetical protein